MRKELTQKEMARKGGLATKRKHGKKYYKKIAKIRWAKSRSKAK